MYFFFSELEIGRWTLSVERFASAEIISEVRRYGNQRMKIPRTGRRYERNRILLH